MNKKKPGLSFNLFNELDPISVKPSGKGDECTGAASVNETLHGNLWIQTTVSDFVKGTNEGTCITGIGDGEVRLIRDNGIYKSGGIYTSQATVTSPFKYLVLSWNADTPKGTSIKIEGQARVKGQWSNWLSWGIWSSTMERASAARDDASDSLAYVDTDTCTVRGNQGETADAFRYRITFYTNNAEATPILRLVAAAIRSTLQDQTIQKVYNDGITEEQLDVLDKVLDVPAYSQTVRDPLLASHICSPTSIAMLLKYRGIDIMPEQAAMGVYDSVYDGCGNWPFNTAYAGNYGFAAYVEYMNSINDIKREILKGNPAAISLKYRNSETVNKPYPVIHGAPITSTGGHLIVVCGFTKGSDGRDYVAVNDPAAKKDSEVRLMYLADEFDEAWKTSGRAAYIVHEKIPGDGEVVPEILKADFMPTGDTKAVDGKAFAEYKLKCRGENINLNRAADPGNPNYERGISIMFSKGDGTYEYVTPTDEKTLWFDTSRPYGKYHYLVFKKTGDSYLATIVWDDETHE